MFDAALVAVERRKRTGETWCEIARDLRVNPATLRSRAAEYFRLGGRKTHPARPDEGGP
jgi:transposase-like protein